MSADLVEEPLEGLFDGDAGHLARVAVVGDDSGLLQFRQMGVVERRGDLRSLYHRHLVGRLLELPARDLVGEAFERDGRGKTVQTREYVASVSVAEKRQCFVDPA